MNIEAAPQLARLGRFDNLVRVQIHVIRMNPRKDAHVAFADHVVGPQQLTGIERHALAGPDIDIVVLRLRRFVVPIRIVLRK